MAWAYSRVALGPGSAHQVGCPPPAPKPSSQRRTCRWEGWGGTPAPPLGPAGGLPPQEPHYQLHTCTHNTRLRPCWALTACPSLPQSFAGSRLSWATLAVKAVCYPCCSQGTDTAGGERCEGRSDKCRGLLTGTASSRLEWCHPAGTSRLRCKVREAVAFLVQGLEQVAWVQVVVHQLHAVHPVQG